MSIDLNSMAGTLYADYHTKSIPSNVRVWFCLFLASDLALLRLPPPSFSLLPLKPLVELEEEVVQLSLLEWQGVGFSEYAAARLIS